MSAARDTTLPASGQRPITAEEYFQMQEGPPYFQLVEGELIMSPSPSYFHQRIIMRLSVLIGSYLENHPIGELIGAPSDVQLDRENVFQPDLYYVSNERRQIFDHQGAKGAPDLVIEVISDSSKRLDLGRKKRRYARSGVTEYWAVHPTEKEVHVYLLQQSVEDPARRFTEREVLESALFPGLQISLSKVFRD